MKLGSVLLLCAIAFAFGFTVVYRAVTPTTADRIADLEQRILQLEIHDCGFVQFEDYSVAVQADDFQRQRCVNEMRGIENNP